MIYQRSAQKYKWKVISILHEKAKLISAPRDVELLIFCSKGDTLLVSAVNPGNDLNSIILDQG